MIKFDFDIELKKIGYFHSPKCVIRVSTETSAPHIIGLAVLLKCDQIVHIFFT
jgi:hypothetical protein